MSDRRKLMDEAIELIARGTCPHCAQVAADFIAIGYQADYAQRWFFLTRASACVHLSAEDRAKASAATSGTSDRPSSGTGE